MSVWLCRIYVDFETGQEDWRGNSYLSCKIDIPDSMEVQPGTWITSDILVLSRGE